VKRSIARIAVMAALTVVFVVPTADALEPLGTIETHRVRMVDGNDFRPDRITISRGDRVRWVNRDNVLHTTTSNGGLWDATLAPGERFTRRFRRAGTFNYLCEFHSGMTGTIVVR
jgi:plastocyanin